MFIIKDGTTGGADTPADIKTQILSWLTGDEKMAVRTKDQDAAFVALQLKEANDKRKIESTVKEITGIDRGATESEEDYVKRALGKKLEDIPTLQAKIKDYENNGADSSALVAEFKKQKEVVEKQLIDQKKTYEETIKTIKGSALQSRIDNEIQNAVSKLTLRKMDDDAVKNTELQETFRKAKIREFKENFTASELEDGVIVFKDKSGNVVRKQDGAAPEGVEVMIKPYFETLIDKGHQQGGAGSGGSAAGGGAGSGAGKDGEKDWSKTKLPDDVKAQTQLTIWLKDGLKLQPNTADFDKAYAHFVKGNDGNGLPMTPK